jgi:recombination protein RecA
MHQLLWPEKINVFVDVEHSFDPKWASLLGVDVEKLIVISPGYAEQIVDLVEGFVDSSDCGIVAIDSIAAMMTTSEGEASAERANVGGATSAVTKLYRKMVKCLGDAERDQRFPTLIYVNQTRYKIGVMFGDPETMPGGNAIRFQAGLWLRVYGKNEMDPTVSSVMPVRKKVSFIVKKWKYPILSVSGNFEMATMPHNGLVVGQCDDFNLIKTYLQTFDMFNKDDKKGWNIFGEHYDTIQPFKDRIFDDKVFGEKIRQTIIDRMLKHGSLLTGGETP